MGQLAETWWKSFTTKSSQGASILVWGCLASSSTPVELCLLWSYHFQTCMAGKKTKSTCTHLHALTHFANSHLLSTHTLSCTVTSGEHHTNHWRATGGDYCDLAVLSLYSSNGADHGDACWVDVLRALMDWRATDESAVSAALFWWCTHTLWFDVGQLDTYLKCGSL